MMLQKLLPAWLLCCYFISSAQPPNWQNLDLNKDSVFGISTEKAYTQLLSHKKKYKVAIAGVLDSGVDTTHEDLSAILWVNPKEIPGNGIDDEHDGYIDDVHGWDFIGGPGGDINKENLELTRMLRSGKASPEMIKEYNDLSGKDKNIIANIKRFEDILDSVVIHIGLDSPSLADFRKYEPRNNFEKQVCNVVEEEMEKGEDYKTFRKLELDDAIKYYQDDLDYPLGLSFNPRTIVGDDTLNPEEHFYGNSDVTGPEALHGTHVAGIIGAIRGNGIGIDGIANHVQIISVRCVPDGDERDKDVANAIRFAVDHGAKVLNMSFGKPYSPDKKVVDEAVKYAMSKDVLLVHAAGNDAKNLDKEVNFPVRVYADSSGSAPAWLEVGASGWKNDSDLLANFSNYGKNTVDVFAPGVQIHSTLPGSKYGDESGTSMAAPVVTGLAVLIREYYPKLSAVQVKNIIMQSVVKPLQLVNIMEKGVSRKVLFSDICVSGGIVNAYNALKLAATYK